jgi:hypothetical protein
MFQIFDFITGTLIYITGTLISWGVSFGIGVVRLLVSSGRREKQTFFSIAVLFALDTYILLPKYSYNKVFWIVHICVYLAPFVYLIRYGRGEYIG